MTSIAVPEEPNITFGPIPGYQSPVTHHIRPPPSIKCAPTRKRAQYRKMYSRHPLSIAYLQAYIMTSDAINRDPRRAKHDIWAYSWIPEPRNTSYSTTTKYQVRTYPQARTISETRFLPKNTTTTLPYYHAKKILYQRQENILSSIFLRDGLGKQTIPLRYMFRWLRIFSSKRSIFGIFFPVPEKRTSEKPRNGEFAYTLLRIIPSSKQILKST